MKTAVVLSGGGAKGAYELGVWKALRKLGIEYDIVVGTSIGALNGIMMAQNDYVMCYKLWYFMDYDQVSSMEIKGKYSTKKGRREILTKYTKGLLKGGYEMDGLSKVIDSAVNIDKFFLSNIDYGLVITHFPSFKGKYVTKKDMNKDNLKEYLLATAACFPAFKPTKVGKELYVDGGYFDNIPVKLALELGADNLIIVDLDAIGITKDVKKLKVPTTIIKPRIKLGSLLVFEKDYTRKYLKMGYYDTLKTYNELDGNIYTFNKGSLNRNYNRIYPKFLKKLKKYEDIITKLTIKRLFKDDNNAYFNDIIETLMKEYKLPYTELYRASYANVLIRKNFLNSDYKKYNRITKVLKLKSDSTDSSIISFMYNEIENDRKNIKKYVNLYPKAFICALYLDTIINKRS